MFLPLIKKKILIWFIDFYKKFPFIENEIPLPLLFWCLKKQKKKKKKTYFDFLTSCLRDIWYTHSNTHFQFLNNITYIFIYFFTHIFLNKKIHIFKQLDQTPQSAETERPKYWAVGSVDVAKSFEICGFLDKLLKRWLNF